MQKDASTSQRPDGGLAGALCRVLVVDDHPLIRTMLKNVIGKEGDLAVVGEARNGREGVEASRELRPDLVLMDVSMPSMNGIAATREIKAVLPRTVVLVVSAHESPDYLMEAIAAGAAGYVLKDAPPARILDAVRRALGGESPLNQELAMRLLRRLSEETDRRGGNGWDAGNGLEAPPDTRVGALERPLTAREMEVLGALAVGKTNRQIAAELSISRATVKTHVERVISKLGVSDRTQAAVKAVRLGLVGEREG
jgi:DNA-binding NarL/FixJ family response regulator